MKYYCAKCDQYYTTKQNMEIHFQSAKHINKQTTYDKKVELLEQRCEDLEKKSKDKDFYIENLKTEARKERNEKMVLQSIIDNDKQTVLEKTNDLEQKFGDHNKFLLESVKQFKITIDKLRNDLNESNNLNLVLRSQIKENV